MTLSVASDQCYRDAVKCSLSIYAAHERPAYRMLEGAPCWQPPQRDLVVTLTLYLGASPGWDRLIYVIGEFASGRRAFCTSQAR